MSCLSNEITSMDTEQSKVSINPLVDTSNVVEKPTCSICHKTFGRIYELRQHIKIHSGERPYICNICGKAFHRKFVFERHERIHESKDKFYKCEKCDRYFRRKDNLQTHLTLHFQRFSCKDCEKVFDLKSNLKQHMRTQHSVKPIVSEKRKLNLSNLKSQRIKQQYDALDVFKTLMFYPDEDKENDLQMFHTQIQPDLEESLRTVIKDKNSIKWYMVEKISLERKTSDEEIQEIQTFFRSSCYIELMEDSVLEHIVEGFSKIINSFEDFLQRGSGWVMKKIHYLELKIAVYHPLASSTYLPLSSNLSATKAILNIKNSDNKCFVWCLIAHILNLNRKQSPKRVSNYIPYENIINLGNIECPVSVDKIPLIEKLNNLRINVFGFEDNEVYPLYVSPKEDEDVINLLMISNEKTSHYCLILNFARLLENLT